MKSWADSSAYDIQATALADAFNLNFDPYKDSADPAIANAGTSRTY